MSTPAARICGPPMPKISTSARCLRAVARRAAYMSPLASPAERRRGMGVMSRRSAHPRSFALHAERRGGGNRATVPPLRDPVPQQRAPEKAGSLRSKRQREKQARSRRSDRGGVGCASSQKIRDEKEIRPAWGRAVGRVTARPYVGEGGVNARDEGRHAALALSHLRE